MPSKFAIDSLEIEGFRGINERLNLKFDRPAMLLFGDNGLGKSSTLGAIEWCLFENLAYIKFLESRTQDELVNSFSLTETVRVKLILNSDNQKYELTREKTLRSKKTEFRLIGPAEELEGEDAERRCFTLLGLTFDDFYRAVFLHQESIRGLLTDDASQRDEAMDRLFGLERMRDIVKSIPIRDVKESVKELQYQKGRLEERVKGQVDIVEKDLQKSLEEAEGLGIPRDKITFENAKDTVESVIARLRKISEEYNVEFLKIEAPTSVDELLKCTGKVKKLLNECRKSVIDYSKISELTHKKTLLIEFQKKYQRLVEELEGIASELNEILEKYGDETKIQSSLQVINKKIQEMNENRNNIDVKSRLLEDALQSLEIEIKDTCPVCNQPIKRENLRENLNEQLKLYEEKTIKEIDKQIRSLKEQKDDFGEALKQVTKLKEEKEKSDQKIEEEINNIRESGTILGKKEVIISDVSKQILEIEESIETFKEAYKAREEEFQKIETNIDKVKKIYDVLKTGDKFEELKKLFPEETKEIKLLREKISELSDFEAQITAFIEAVTKVQNNLALEFVSKSSEDISEFYGKLCNHPYYGGIRIEVQPRRVAGYIKNSYLIRAFNPSEGRQTLVSTRFSAGQMNCVALAIYLALSKTLTHKLGFLILDDPSQNLDTEHKRALVKILNKMLSHHQLIISTQDTELQNFIKSELHPSKGRYIYKFTQWDKKGPKITIEG